MLFFIIGYIFCETLNYDYQRGVLLTPPDGPSDVLDYKDVFFTWDTEKLNNDGKLQGDCKDMAFIYRDEETSETEELDFWIENECPSEKSIIWVRFKNVTNSSVNIMWYYGNSDETKQNEEDFDGYFFGLSKTDECPDGWEEESVFENYYIKSSDNFGTEHAEHDHNHIFDESSGIADGSFVYCANNGTEQFMAADDTHTHQFYHKIVAEMDELYFIAFHWCRKEKFIWNKSLHVIYGDSDLPRNVSIDQQTLFKFIVGAGTINTPGTIGGTTSHSHEDIENLQLDQNTEGSLSDFAVHGSTISVDCQYHTHSISSFQIQEEVDHLPPFIDVKYAIIETDTFDQTEGDMLYIVSAVPPLGFVIAEETVGKFLRGSSTFGTEGGKETHLHTYEAVIESKSECTCSNINETEILKVKSDHIHTLSGKSSEISNYPKYIDVLVVRRVDTKDWEINILQEYDTLKDDDTDDGETETNVGLIVLFVCLGVGFVTVFFVLFMSVFLVIFLVVFFRQRGKIKKLEAIEDIDILLREQELENADETTLKLNFKFNKELFEINRDEMEMISEIGVGGSGAMVFKAKWKNQEVAYKVFNLQNLGNQIIVDEFQRELKVITSINHPNILSFFGCTLKIPRIGLVMEFCKNGSLSDFLDKKKEQGLTDNMRFSKYLPMAKGICNGMVFLHSKSIIHRDLKPDNILITETLAPKIIDFGVSRFFNSTTMTRYVGTAGYMAPEIVLGNNYDGKVDIFSFSIIMYHLLTGKTRAYGNQDKFVDAVVARDPNFRPKIDSERYGNRSRYTKLMKRCWSHEPKDRPTFDIILDELGKIKVSDLDESESQKSYAFKNQKKRKKPASIVNKRGQLVPTPPDRKFTQELKPSEVYNQNEFYLFSEKQSQKIEDFKKRREEKINLMPEVRDLTLMRIKRAITLIRIQLDSCKSMEEKNELLMKFLGKIEKNTLDN